MPPRSGRLKLDSHWHFVNSVRDASSTFEKGSLRIVTNHVRGPVVLRHLMVICITVFELLSAGVAASAQGQSGSEKAESLFKTHCAVCHGTDGAGTALGKRLQAPDLRSKEIQDRSSTELAQIINKGKNNMPSFGQALDGQQVREIVWHIHRFRMRAPSKSK
jgi:mono/diheme cytochrome c family protein